LFRAVFDKLLFEIFRENNKLKRDEGEETHFVIIANSKRAVNIVIIFLLPAHLKIGLKECYVE